MNPSDPEAIASDSWWPIRFVMGALGKGWTLWREGRFEPSPSVIVTHLRNYYRELHRSPPVVVSYDLEALSSQRTRGTSGRRVLLVASETPESRDPPNARDVSHTLHRLRECGHAVTVFCQRGHHSSSFVQLTHDPAIIRVTASNVLQQHLRSEGLSYDWVVVCGANFGGKHILMLRAYAARATLVYVPLAAEDSEWPDTGSAASGLEELCLASADVVIARSLRERDAIRRVTPSSRVIMAVEPDVAAYNSVFGSHGALEQRRFP